MIDCLMAHALLYFYLHLDRFDVPDFEKENIFSLVFPMTVK